MKLTINYDLLDKIRQSENGAKLYKSEVLKLLNVPIIKFFLCKHFIDLIYSFALDIRLGVMLSICDELSFILTTLINNMLLIIIKQRREKIAAYELQNLVTQLYSLEVKTTTELLKESKLNTVNYKIIYKDDDIKKPRLKQEKYIDIPLSNGYEETVLQEYIFGYNDYELSVKSPDTKKVYKPVRTV